LLEGRLYFHGDYDGCCRGIACCYVEEVSWAEGRLV